MTWLVTGGAGYIGSHVAAAFRDSGIEVVALDDLSSGREEFVPVGVVLEHGTLLDESFVGRVFAKHRLTGVVHLAGYKYAGMSVQRPVHTYEQNITATINLLAAMHDTGVASMVFSSSAAVYGTPPVEFVTEETVTRPESPYGETKLAGEWLINAQARATQLRATSLRYFNVVGSADGGAPDTSPYNLFPLVFRALEAATAPKIFGDDYATPDGTCVRDYVHVVDVAAAHVAAARALDAGTPLERVYNLGSGTGISVRQIMDEMALATGMPFTAAVAPARPGDPARIVASGELAARDIGWATTHTLAEMIASAWAAHGARHA